MLARSGPLPTGSGWSYEVKWDGFRAIVCSGFEFRVRSRRGWNMTPLLPELRALPIDAVLDGEYGEFGWSTAIGEVISGSLPETRWRAAARRCGGQAGGPTVRASPFRTRSMLDLLNDGRFDPLRPPAGSTPCREHGSVLESTP
jgi:hypothetical protein